MSWLVLATGSISRAAETSSGAEAQTIEEPEVEVPIPPAIADPFEPVNRGIGILNHGIMKGVVQPTSYIYRFAVCRPMRLGILRAQRNIAYPGRLINNLLQRKWSGAEVETERFLVNSTLGIGGFFDVATKMGIGISDEDFGQTFGTWGWDPQFYLLVPLLGPTNDRDGVGSILDTTANPATYLSPLPWIFGYNRLAHEIHRYNAFVSSEQDPYNIGREVWTWQRAAAIRPMQYQSEISPATESLRAVLFRPKSPEFGTKAIENSVYLATTGRRFPYSAWLQKETAPLVYMLPAIGDHRHGPAVANFAEHLYDAGFSVVAISSVFNHEFINRGLSVALPGYVHLDVQDIYAALDATHADLLRRYPDRLGEPMLLGLSMGGYHTLMLAAHPEFQSRKLKFNRFVALHAPVNLTYALRQMDEYYNAPLEWIDPAELRVAGASNDIASNPKLIQKLRETFMKAVRLADDSLTLNDPMPFTDIEAKYLIGVRSRIVIRDTIYASQARRNLGILEHPISFWSRKELYDEIQSYSLAEYLNRFVLPYYEEISSPSVAAEHILAAADLKTNGERLRENETVHIIANENDFLLPAGDIEWLRTMIPPARRLFFPSGGHMGNILDPTVRQATIAALRGD